MLVNPSGQDALTRSGLAHEEDGGVTLGGDGGHLPDAPHGRAVAEEGLLTPTQASTGGLLPMEIPNVDALAEERGQVLEL